MKVTARHPCVQCGEVFTIPNGRAKFCSAKCSFLNKVEKTPTDCWGWSGILHRGYAAFYFGRGNHFLAHRFSYEIHCGEIPPGYFVCHRCDNPACTNPDHLFLGTHRDNMIDCIEKGRHGRGSGNVRGEKNGMALLTNNAVRAIRVSREPRKVLAARYGVSEGCICHVRYGKTWKHVI